LYTSSWPQFLKGNNWIVSPSKESVKTGES
jgi:hypothetical protein